MLLLFRRRWPSGPKHLANALVSEVEFFCFLGGLAQQSGTRLMPIRVKELHQLVIRAPRFLKAGSRLQTKRPVILFQIHVLSLDEGQQFLAAPESLRNKIPTRQEVSLMFDFVRLSMRPE